jgi:hypothetical protein
LGELDGEAVGTTTWAETADALTDAAMSPITVSDIRAVFFMVVMFPPYYVIPISYIVFG